jgi:hypothetical protein
VIDLSQPPVGEPEPEVTLKGLFDTYTEKLTAGSKEANTLDTEAIHCGHLLTMLGDTALGQIVSFGRNERNYFGQVRTTGAVAVRVV